MEQEYSTLQKGSGVLYACANVLYRRTRTVGNVKYLKRTVIGFDGSAKLDGDKFYLGVSGKVTFLLLAIGTVFIQYIHHIIINNWLTKMCYYVKYRLSASNPVAGPCTRRQPKNG